jgi:hypothetical protein
MHYKQGGEIVPNCCFGGKVASKGSFSSSGRKIARNALVQGELAFMHLGALFCI